MAEEDRSTPAENSGEKNHQKTPLSKIRPSGRVSGEARYSSTRNSETKAESITETISSHTSRSSQRDQKSEQPEASAIAPVADSPSNADESPSIVAQKRTTQRRRAIRAKQPKNIAAELSSEATTVDIMSSGMKIAVSKTDGSPENSSPKQRPGTTRATPELAKLTHEEKEETPVQATSIETTPAEDLAAEDNIPDVAVAEAESADETTKSSRRRRRGHRGGVGRRRQSAEPAITDISPTTESEPEEESQTAVTDAKSAEARNRGARPRNLGDIDASPSQTKELSFMHPSEREFANLLDYYQIKYLYEPRSFPLRWEGNRVTEMHTPDFYLPEYDQYFELTTMKQNLVTQKNRKLRHVQEMYPEINIQLLYRRDLMRLMGKYGFGPLAEVDVAGTESVLFTQERVQARVKEIGQQIAEDYDGQEPILIGVLRGVVVFMADLMRAINLPVQIEFMEISHYGEEREDAIDVLRDVTTDLKGRAVIVVEDIVDTGLTLSYLLEHLKTKEPSSIVVCCLLDKSVRRMAQIPLSYVGFEIPDEFVIGYGLDYGGRYRNLPYIGLLKPVEPKAVAQR